MTFEDLDLHPRLLAGLGLLAGSPLTPVQQQALPPILEGRDVLVAAPPTDGNAALYALPVLQRTIFGPRGRVQAVILAPTREQVEFAAEAIAQLGKHTRVRTLTLCSDQTLAQSEALRDGAEIVVACPAQLLEHISRGSIDLSRASFLIFEQLDQLCDMGFLPQLWRIVKATPSDHQALAFCTTDNETLRENARTLLHEPDIIQVGEVEAVPSIKHRFYHVEPEFKTEALLTLLEFEELPAGALLIFCNNRFRARRVGERLKHAGYTPAILTDELSPRRREHAIRNFLDHIAGIIVTTDTAAQGLNVSGITHILNFDMPDAVETYLHRAGRVAYDRPGCTAVSLITPDDEDIVEAVTIELGQHPEHRTLPFGSD